MWALDGEAAAKAAEARLHEQSFVEHFLADLGDAQPAVLGRHAVIAGPPEIHVDLVPLRFGAVVSLVVLADSPQPFPDVDRVAERLRRRLP